MDIIVVTILLILSIYTFFMFQPVFNILHSIHRRIKSDEYKSKETCDIITPLNTYTNVYCDTICFYEECLTFKYKNGVTVEVSPETATIEFHNSK